MKKVLFVFAILFLSLTFTKGQTNVYHPFPTDTAQWSVKKTIAPSGPALPTISTSHLNERGDTTINSKTYKKIYRTNIENYFAPIQYLKCFMREDSTRKIFVKYPNNSLDYYDTTEFVLYDFNLSVGDTFTTKMAFNEFVLESKLVLLSIDSFNTNFGYRRSFKLNLISFGALPPYGNNMFIWVEGIGCLFTPFYNEIYQNYYLVGIIILNELICFQENFNYIISASSCHQDNYGLSENNKVSISSISPNPFTLSTQITLPQTYHNIALAVYDIQGKLLAQQQYKDCSQIQLNRNQLSNGLYFLKLTLDDKEVETGKIVIGE